MQETSDILCGHKSRAGVSKGKQNRREGGFRKGFKEKMTLGVWRELPQVREGKQVRKCLTDEEEQGPRPRGVPAGECTM